MVIGRFDGNDSSGDGACLAEIDRLICRLALCARWDWGLRR